MTREPVVPSPNTVEKSNRAIFITILICAAIGLAAAFVLTIERAHLMADPNAVLSCSFNIVLNCASVMKTWQAEVFGFPNSYIGLMAYPVLIALAVGYLAGARYKRWFMNSAQIGVTLGLIFAYWLFFQSVFVIQVLCPWCLLVTTATTIIFEAFTRYNLRENNFGLSKNLHAKVLGWLQKDYDKFIAAAWLVLMVILVLVKFPDIFG
jgi:uncharacterized membrane protein